MVPTVRSAIAVAAGVLAGCGPGPRTEGPPSIVLVSLDTFRADRLGALGHPGGLTPSLDRFAAEAVVFTHAYSQATLTAPSHASVFSSRYPSEQAAHGRAPVFPASTPPLAELLRLYGFRTGAFVGGADLNPAMQLDVGFETYTSPADFGSLWHTSGPALAWIDTRDTSRPFFAFVHGYDAHSRYLKPTPFGYVFADASRDTPGARAVRGETERIADGVLLADPGALQHVYGTRMRPRDAEGRVLLAERAEGEPLADGDVEHVRAVYDAAIAYADLEFGLLMAGLRDAGVLDEVVVVVMSDHGEQLGEHGLFGHSYGVSDLEAHVPLMVRMPGGAGGGRRVDAVVELVDLAPTLLELAGVPAPAEIHGRSFAAALRGEAYSGRVAAMTQGDDRMRSVSARSRTTRLTYTGVACTSPLLPELLEAARVDGPGFTVEGDPAEAEVLRGELVAWLRTLAPSPKERASRLPAALRDSLRAHGYWDAR
ncbi:MAG: sulfatase [Myxococcota bacterium]